MLYVRHVLKRSIDINFLLLTILLPFLTVDVVEAYGFEHLFLYNLLQAKKSTPAFYCEGPIKSNVKLKKVYT